jgi:ComF family protein
MEPRNEINYIYLTLVYLTLGGELIILNKILDLLYPPVCGICGKGKNTYLCKKCEIKLKREAVFGIDEYQDKYFDKHYYIFRYDSFIRKIILDYKFNEKPFLYKSFINFFNKYQKKYLQIDFYDIIVPVPISKKRLKQRGYNQSYLIAKEISEILNIKIEKDILVKKENNIQQSTLNKEEREKNVQDVYEIKNKESIKDKKILLIDDIFTTGATVNECSKLLKSAGAEKIDIFTIAKD